MVIPASVVPPPPEETEPSGAPGGQHRQQPMDLENTAAADRRAASLETRARTNMP